MDPISNASSTNSYGAGASRAASSNSDAAEFSAALEKAADTLGASSPAAGKADVVSGRIGIDLRDGKPVRVRYFDENGNGLTTSTFSAASILRLTEKFGIDRNDLIGLASQMDQQGIGYKPYELYPGTGSDHGIDLVDLAKGGLGTAYDWRRDENVVAKGPHARARHDALVPLADQLGVQANPEVTTGGGIDPSRFTPLKGGDGLLRSFVSYTGGSASWHTSREAAEARHVSDMHTKIFDLLTQSNTNG